MSRKLIDITSKAVSQLINLKKIQNKQYIEFTLKSGGCNGFSYNFKPTNESPKKDDNIIEKDKLKLYVNDIYLFHLIGTKIDWEESNMGSMFTFDNPNANSMCGCGKSFNPK